MKTKQCTGDSEDVGELLQL